MPPRTSSDRRAAGSQLKSVDQSARVGKGTRAKEANGEITVPLAGKQPVTDEEGELVRDDEGKIVYEPVTRDFRLADEVGIMPLMEWVSAAEGRDNESAKSLIAIFHVLEDTVHEDEWAEFRRFARESKLGAKPLGDFINASLEAVAGRPTEEPSGS